MTQLALVLAIVVPAVAGLLTLVLPQRRAPWAPAALAETRPGAAKASRA